MGIHNIRYVINLTKKNSFYGFINYFEKKKIVGNFTYFEIEKNCNKFLKKKINLFYLINFIKLDFIISFFINKYSLKIFYFLIFNLKNLIKFRQIITTKRTTTLINKDKETFLTFFVIILKILSP